MKILVVGGYGVFGSRLCRLLLRRPGSTVWVAGRSLAQAQRFCAEHGGEPCRFDRDADLRAQLAALAPDVVVDAAGPFQAYGADPYRLARAALEAGAHYLDLADDADFVSGIAVLDELARARGLVALAGASSVPAISSSAADVLAEDLRVDSVETLILPGNRAPRGLSVMRAIVGQAGRPMRLWRGGAWQPVPGWSGLRRETLRRAGRPALPPRWASFISVPDLQLFPARYGARSVEFRAGLELSLMHLGLWWLASLPRLGLVRSLEPAAALLLWIADRLRSFGSDRGGMRVRLRGRDVEGHARQRDWTLVAEAGDGPFIPALAAVVLIGLLARGALRTGARPCLGEAPLAALEREMRALRIEIWREEAMDPVLYERILGSEFARLPCAVREAHEVQSLRVFSGRASVENGQSVLAGLCRVVMRLPPAAADLPLRVTMERFGARERWTREFGAHRFHSWLSQPADAAPGAVMERFGPLSFRLRLPVDSGGLTMPLERGYFLGVPLPRFLTPRSDTREFVDGEGRFRFDVAISLPFIGLVVRYQGWLKPG